jgi:branched-chain amino acid transport system ATP-binding protein
VTDVVLSLEGLTAGYDGAPVIRDVELTVAAGEVVALLGPNGAGKTTTLRAVSGLVHPLAGRIVYAGGDTAKLSPEIRARRGIAHVPEGRGLFFGLTVAEHFRLGHRGERLDSAHAFEYFPALADLQQRRTGLLSGGEQQMLAVARALARRPRLLLLDELSLGLAPVVVELRGRGGGGGAPRRPPRPARARDRRPRLRALARGGRAAPIGGGPALRRAAARRQLPRGAARRRRLIAARA